jgi:hypothetical protein
MVKYREIDNIKIASPVDENFIISSTQDAVDMLGEAGLENCSRIIIYERNLHSDFFKLYTGLAGDILQKFSNYRFKLAIIGDFSKFKSKSLQDFIRESNKGNTVFFVTDIDNALFKLVPKHPAK